MADAQDGGGAVVPSTSAAAPTTASHLPENRHPYTIDAPEPPIDRDSNAIDEFDLNNGRLPSLQGHSEPDATPPWLPPLSEVAQDRPQPDISPVAQVEAVENAPLQGDRQSSLSDDPDDSDDSDHTDKSETSIILRYEPEALLRFRLNMPLVRHRVKEDDVIFKLASRIQRSMLIESRAAFWSPPLALRDYLYVVNTLERTEVSRGRVEHWLLQSHDHEHFAFASCAVHIREAFVATSNGAQVIDTAVVTDLYTLPNYRMKGLATLLLKKVCQVLDDRFDFSVVYCGPYVNLFRGLGWRPHDKQQLRITVCAVVPFPPASEVRVMDWRDVEGAAKEDRRLSRMRMSAAPRNVKHIQMVPSVDLAKWHFMREALYIQQLGSGRPRPTTRGAMYVGDKVLSGSVSVWWVRDLVRCRLVVCRFALARAAGLEAGVEAVLRAAVAEAASWGLREVVVWDPVAQVVEGARLLDERLTIALERRMDAIPCLRWRGGEDRDVVWTDNEYYGWC